MYKMYKNTPRFSTGKIFCSMRFFFHLETEAHEKFSQKIKFCVTLIIRSKKSYKTKMARGNRALH